MASNSFGSIFRITTWGESHGKALGVVIDGCPSGVPLHDNLINTALARRAPGQTPYTSPRAEKDHATIVSGLFEGVSTGAPICISIENNDADSSKYHDIAQLLRPGHANATYLHKYGVFDHRGGGRASARETAARVACGAVAKAFAETGGAQVVACLAGAGQAQEFITSNQDKKAALGGELNTLAKHVAKSPIFAPNAATEAAIIQEICNVKDAHDSIGGTIAFFLQGLPAGLGEPVYEKFSAKLAYALMSIPACKGFELGQGFASAAMRGSAHNDSFCKQEKGIAYTSNMAGGTLGGITTGEIVYGRVAFKPTSSIELPQNTVNKEGDEAVFILPHGSRHDPCVAVRAVPVVEAMCWIVLADALLMHRSATARQAVEE